MVVAATLVVAPAVSQAMAVAVVALRVAEVADVELTSMLMTNQLSPLWARHLAR